MVIIVRRVPKKIKQVEKLVLYKWQKETPIKWNENGRRGIVKAVPGAGKSIAAIEVMNYVRAENPDIDITVVCPSSALVKQWKDMKLDVNVITYYNTKNLTKTGLLILDECHSVQSPKRQKILNIKYDYILGLSATPEESDKFIGKIFIDISWDKANVAPFEIHHINFDMESNESMRYDVLSNRVKWAMADYNKEKITHKQFMITVMKRRSFVYELPQRVEISLNLIRKHSECRIVVFSERLEQLDKLAKRLDEENIDYSICTSVQNTIDKFVNHKTNLLLTSRMLKEGYDDKTINMGIIMSTPLSERNHIQTIGRIVRQHPGKKANIYVLLASGTTDENLGEKSVLMGTRYSLDTNRRIFIKHSGKRTYALSNPSELLEILKQKGSGRFWLNDQGEVRAYIEKELVLLGIFNGKIEFEEQVL